MNAFNPIASLQRFENAGFKRGQAEVLAEELHHATTELVTKDDLAKALDAQSNKITLRLGGVMAALLGLFFASLKLFS